MLRYYFYAALFLLAAVSAFFAISFSYRTQPLQTESIQEAEFGKMSLRIEYATTTAARERGLGGRRNIADDYAMLFVFPNDGYYGFWMKDTLVPLDMFWLDDKGQVTFFARDVATSTYPHVFYPSEPARYVLETAAGFAQANGITIGTPLVLQNWPRVSE
ncbi:MAG: DUF192 domain-containing protein [Patescibacteria group bacterium]|nr:DUF192 domain-containing protein [Patescibacteria group bacterium]